MLLLQLAHCVRVMQRKNSKQFVTRYNKTLVDHDIDIANINKQRVLIHKRKLYFFDNKAIGFAVANSVEIRMADEDREIGYFSSRRVVDAFHLKNKEEPGEKTYEKTFDKIGEKINEKINEKIGDKGEKVDKGGERNGKRDRIHRNMDPTVKDFLNAHRSSEKPTTRQPAYTRNPRVPKEFDNAFMRPKSAPNSNYNQSPPWSSDPMPNNMPQPNTAQSRDRNNDYNYVPNRYNDNAPNDAAIPGQRYTESNEPYFNNKQGENDKNNMQMQDSNWQENTNDKINLNSLQKKIDDRINLPLDLSAPDRRPIEDKEDKHHTIESDSSYDGDEMYGITKLDVYIEELKNGYFKLNNNQNCITYFEKKYIFGICTKNDVNQEFRLVNADEILNKIKEEREKKVISSVLTAAGSRPREVTVTVTATPDAMTSIVPDTSNYFNTYKSDKSPPNTNSYIEPTVSLEIPKRAYTEKIKPRDDFDDKSEDIFDRNSGDLLDALQKNFSFKDMPF